MASKQVPTAIVVIVLIEAELEHVGLYLLLEGGGSSLLAVHRRTKVRSSLNSDIPLRDLQVITSEFSLPTN